MLLTCSRCNATLTRPARFCPNCGEAISGGNSEFHRWRLRVCKRQAVFCAVAIPIGLLFLEFSPPTTLIVSGLGLLGLIVSLRRLSRHSAMGRP